MRCRGPGHRGASARALVAIVPSRGPGLLLRWGWIVKWHHVHSMNRSFCIILAVIASALVSCRYHDRTARVSQEIVLTQEHPTHPSFGLRLVSIAPSGRTAVEFSLPDTKDTFEAMPGERFHSKTAGQRDVLLVSVSPDKAEARLRVSYCISK